LPLSLLFSEDTTTHRIEIWGEKKHVKETKKKRRTCCTLILFLFEGEMEC